MGQYFKLINETKQEQITAWELNGVAKFFEWLYNNQARVLVWLLRKSDESGGGDICLNELSNYQTLGRWAGDKITLIGDYDSSEMWTKTQEWNNIAKLVMKEYNEVVESDLGKNSFAEEIKL